MRPGERIDVGGSRLYDTGNHGSDLLWRLPLGQLPRIRSAMDGIHPEFRINDARRHERYLDLGVGLLDLRPERRRQGIEEVLRPTICGPHRRVRNPAEHRGNVDDVTAATIAKVRLHLLHPVQSRFHVRRHHQIYIVIGQL